MWMWMCVFVCIWMCALGELNWNLWNCCLMLIIMCKLLDSVSICSGQMEFRMCVFVCVFSYCSKLLNEKIWCVLKWIRMTKVTGATKGSYWNRLSMSSPKSSSIIVAKVGIAMHDGRRFWTWAATIGSDSGSGSNTSEIIFKIF